MIMSYPFIWKRAAIEDVMILAASGYAWPMAYMWCRVWNVQYLNNYLVVRQQERECGKVTDFFCNAAELITIGRV